MVDVVAATSDLTVLGGPSQIQVQLDLGSPGQRGSQIYTGPGRPTDPGVFIPNTLVNDMFINLNPSSPEYLYLYQFLSSNGIDQWSRLFRLVPNTILVNPAVRFINGEAHTVVKYLGQYRIIRGLYFPLAAFFETVDIGNLTPKDFNIQYNIINNNPIQSSLTVNTISAFHNIEIYDPITQTYIPFPSFPFGVQTLSVDLKAWETPIDTTPTSNLLNGYNIVHFIATVGGRSDAVLNFDATAVTPAQLPLSPGTITIQNHGLTTGDIVAYMNNNNANIGGISNNTEYGVFYIDSDTISLIDIATQQPIILSDSGTTGTHSFVTFQEI